MHMYYSRIVYRI